VRVLVPFSGGGREQPPPINSPSVGEVGFGAASITWDPLVFSVCKQDRAREKREMTNHTSNLRREGKEKA